MKASLHASGKRHVGLTSEYVRSGESRQFWHGGTRHYDSWEGGAQLAPGNSERIFEAELYRLKARALLMRGAPDAEAETLLDQALRTARSQQAQSLELRAATDLARLWMNQGKCAEALDVLASIHGRLTEGFDTRDLKEAKAVLVQLQ
jgi:predicted ATPase